MNKFEILLSRGYTMDKHGNLFNPKGVEIKGYINTKNNYSTKVTSARVDGKGVKIPFHRLQAYLKFGNEMFKDGIEVRHLNGDSLDNSFENIAIGTHSDNMQDIPKEKRILKSSLAGLKHNYQGIKEHTHLIKMKQFFCVYLNRKYAIAIQKISHKQYD